VRYQILRFFVQLSVLALFCGVLLAGFIFVILPAFDYLPSLGRANVSLSTWRSIVALPGFSQSLVATLFSGFLATSLALFLAFTLIGWLSVAARPCGAVNNGWYLRVQRLIFSTPHGAFALGFAFLLAPGGWLARLITGLMQFLFPRVTGPYFDVVILRDRWGIALGIGLALKEAAFLTLMMLPALRRLRPEHFLTLARTLGYSPAMAWVKLVLPQLYLLIRLPVLAVLAYGLSVVDVSLLLGPNLSPTLAVLVLQKMQDPDLTQRFLAARIALVEFGVVISALALWRICECGVASMARPFLSDGTRDVSKDFKFVAKVLGHVLRGYTVFLAILSILALFIWSVAGNWYFPEILPQALSFENWMRAIPLIRRAFVTSIVLAAAVSLVAVLLSILCLESEVRSGGKLGALLHRAVYLPLLMPQITLLFGIQIVLIILGLTGTVWGIFYCHLLFVFSYTYLSLRIPWQAFDLRYEHAARGLGAGYGRFLLRVKLPMLGPSLMMASMLGFAVSLTLYLPTVIASDGRYVTLASESIALAAGGDRHMIGVYGSLQTLLVWICFASMPLIKWLIKKGDGDGAHG